MVPARRTVLGIAVVVLLVLVVVQPPVTALPGVADGTGPTEIRVTEFERLESGCVDDVGGYVRSNNGPNGTLSRTTFVETGGPDANLSVTTERTSPPGADLGSFRVHVDSHGTETNASCRTGVQYTITVQTEGRNPPGLFDDPRGTRVLWLENGEYAGCSSSTVLGLDDDCGRFTERTPDAWANATR